jgi:O-antigen/teichoic acid export membrane protein
MKRLLPYFPIPLREVARVARLTPFDTSTAEGRSHERYRRIVLSIGTSVASRIISGVVGLAIVPIAISYLGKEQYGLWAAINAFAPWVLLFDLGLASALVNPMAEAHGRDDHTSARAYFSTTLAVLVGIAALLLLGVLVLFSRPSTLGPFPIPAGLDDGTVRATLAVGLGLFVATLPLNALPQVYAGYQRSYVTTVYATAATLASLGLLVAAVHRHASLPWILAAANAAPILGGVLTIAYLWIRDMPWMRPTLGAVSRIALRRLLATSIPLYAFQIGALLVNQSQQLVLARRAGLATVAEYDLLLRIYILTTSLITASSSSFAPSFREAFERGETAWMRRSFSHLVRLRMALALAACAVIAPAGNLALRLWLRRSDFQYGMPVWLTLCALILVVSWTSSFGELLTVLDRIWPQVIVVIVQGALTILLTATLSPRFGVLGALLAITLPAALLTGTFMPRMARALLARSTEPEPPGSARR